MCLAVSRTFLNGGLSRSLINNTSTGSQWTQPWYWSWLKNCFGTPVSVLPDIDRHQVFLEDHALCEHSSFNRAVTSTRVVTANREFLDCEIKILCLMYPLQFAITLRLVSIPNIPSFYFLCQWYYPLLSLWSWQSTFIFHNHCSELQKNILDEAGRPVAETS